MIGSCLAKDPDDLGDGCHVQFADPTLPPHDIGTMGVLTSCSMGEGHGWQATRLSERCSSFLPWVCHRGSELDRAQALHPLAIAAYAAIN